MPRPPISEQYARNSASRSRAPVFLKTSQVTPVSSHETHWSVLPHGTSWALSQPFTRDIESVCPWGHPPSRTVASACVYIISFRVSSLAYKLVHTEQSINVQLNGREQYISPDPSRRHFLQYGPGKASKSE